MSSENLHEECGIAAVYQLDQKSGPFINVTQYIPGLLLDLQNRGQLSAGLTSYNPERNRLLQTYKDLGTVGQVFRMYHSKKAQNLISKYSGTSAIAHVRYATSGMENRNFAQPFERVHGRKCKWFSIAFNGNLANVKELKKELIQKGYHITYNTDTEVMMHCFNKELSGETHRSYTDIFNSLYKVFDGAFNIAFLNGNGDMVIMRGPMGIKPFCYGIKDNLLFVSSESVALTRLGIMDFKDLEPGSLLIATKEKYYVERYKKKGRKAHCFFEWVYFANLASTLDGRSVYKVRRELGKYLAKMENQQIHKDDIVISVPETAKAAASGFSYQLGIPSMEGLVRNRYVGRTFIEGESRKEAIMRKFTPLPEILENKKIFIVDDSLVRAVTLKTLIADLKERGKVKEVHVRIACPPIIAPCFYGIAIPTVKELFATKYWKRGEPLDLSQDILDKMAVELEADSIIYLNIEGLVKAINKPKEDLCLACINTEYPSDFGEKNYRELINTEYNL